MNYYLYLIFIPIIIIFLYVFIKVIYLKFFKKNKSIAEHGIEEVEEDIKDVKDFVSGKIKNAEKVGSEILHKSEEISKNGLVNTKLFLLSFFETSFIFLKKYFIKMWHFILHFIVLFLGYLSDSFDKLYAKARNTFLYTATKEKGSVTTFWKHLKEYKKEVEEDWKKK